MAKTLDVYLHSEFVGHLTQDNGGQMIFQYAESWLDRPGASPLSQSLPLRKERFLETSVAGTSAASCRKRASARSSLAISASAPAMTTPCWSRSAVNAPEL